MCRKPPIICFAFVFGYLALSASHAMASSYRYDQEQSHVRFTLKHLGIITASGEFKSFSGQFKFDPVHIEKSSVSLKIETASIYSGNVNRDTRLRSKDFFWSEKHPFILFESTSIGHIRDDCFDINGNLTIRGITQPVVFETTLLTDKKTIGNATSLAFKTFTFIHRKDFHLGTENWMDPIMLVTGETLKISLEVEGIPLNTEEGKPVFF